MADPISWLFVEGLKIIFKCILKPIWVGLVWLAKKSFNFLVRDTWMLIYDCLRPQPWKNRPLGITLVATSVAGLAIYFYIQELHGHQVTILKWIYFNSGIVNWWHPDKLDFLKLPAKSPWFGVGAIFLASFGLMNLIWQQMKRHIESEKGLEYFTTWTIKAIDSNTEYISIAANTPLIHIFHDNLKKDELSSYGGNITFEEKFCYPFRDAITKFRQKIKNVRFLYIAPEILQVMSPFPIEADDDYQTYINGISNFMNSVVDAYAKNIQNPKKRQDKIDATFRKTTQIPLWIAVIRRNDPLIGPSGAVVLGLTNRRDLTKDISKGLTGIEKKKAAQKIAEDVMCLRSTDPEIVKFFHGVFESLWDDASLDLSHILSLLQRARRGHKIEVLLREPYNSDLHKDLTPGSPDQIIYTTKPR